MRYPSKETAERIKTAKKQGWEFAGYTGKGHPRLRHPETGHTITVAASPSTQAGRRRFEADLRKLGAAA